MKNDTFTCEKCNKTYIKNRTDQQAYDDAKSNPWMVKDHPCGVVCEDCFEKFKVWFATLTEEDHKRYRGEGRVEELRG